MTSHNQQLLNGNLDNEESTSQIKATNETAFNHNIVETKELLQYRSDNIAYFVTSNGSPCDKGSKALIEANKIPVKCTLQVGNINEIKKSNNKYLFGLCIREEISESQVTIKDNLYHTLVLLRESLISKYLKEFSIAKSPYVENIPWRDILEIFKEVFDNVSIKIIVCKGTLQYVTGNQRDEILKELHNSPIVGHRGVSKTEFGKIIIGRT